MKKLLLGAVLSAICLGAAHAEEPVVGKVIQLKDLSQGTPVLKYQLKGGTGWSDGYLQMSSRLHDKYQTNASTVAALEFLLGGRVGINKDSEIEIVTEKSVKDAKTTVKKVLIRKGGIWAKTSGLKEPLEIQTNGGVMGIKGTEFVIDSQPNGETSVAVLDGAVEVTDLNGKVIGQAKPGDQYLLPYKGVPVVKSYGSGSEGVQKLRTELIDNRGWQQANEVLNFVTYFTGWGGLGSTGSEVFRAVNQASVIANLITNPADAGKEMRARLERELNSRKPRGPFGVTPPDIKLGDDSKLNFPSSLNPDGASGGKYPGTAANRPTFSWTGVDDANGYLVMVDKDGTFNQVEWSAITKDTNLPFNPNAVALSRGRHYWRVIPLNEKDEIVPGKQAAQTYFDVQ